MTRMRFSDFKAMYQSPFNDLYHALLGAGAKTEPGNVVIGLNVDRLKEAFQRRWQEFVRLNPDKILGEPASDPELDAVTNPDPTPVAPVKPVVTKQTLNKMDRDIKDLEEAQVRFRYWQSQGLLNTTENSLLIESWLATQEGDHYSAAGLDRCITANRAALMWYVPPVIERLRNGDERMPLTARPSSRWTKAQLQDWDVRRLAAISAERRKKNTELAKSLAV